MNKRRKAKPIAYKVERVFGLHFLENAYNVSLMHLPAIYVFYDHKYCMYELEDEGKVMEKFKCEVYEI